MSGRLIITTAGCFAGLDLFDGDRVGCVDSAGGQLGSSRHWDLASSVSGIAKPGGVDSTDRAARRNLEQPPQYVNRFRSGYGPGSFRTPKGARSV